MFAGLNEVCDVFFVPALEVLVEVLDMDMTVAGATFMAAGGSAPELFTSFFGTFVAKSNVGFGTIVGSAVFNILFVIGVCAIAASNGTNPDGTRKALELTPYPLCRDSLWYILSLLTLVIFFMDQTIEWWEALIQFLVYVAYVAFMMRNAFYEKRALKLCPCLRPRHLSPRKKWLQSKLMQLVRRSEMAVQHPEQFEGIPLPEKPSEPPRAKPAPVGFTPAAISITAGSPRLASTATQLSVTAVTPASGSGHGAAANVVAISAEDSATSTTHKDSNCHDSPASIPSLAGTQATPGDGVAEGNGTASAQSEPVSSQLHADDAARIRSRRASNSWNKLRQAVKVLDAMSAMIKCMEQDDGEPEGVPEDYLAWPTADDKDEEGNPKSWLALRILEFVIMVPIRFLTGMTIPDPVPKKKRFCCCSRGPCDALCGDDDDVRDATDGKQESEVKQQRHDGEDRRHGKNAASALTSDTIGVATGSSDSAGSVDGDGLPHSSAAKASGTSAGAAITVPAQAAGIANGVAATLRKHSPLFIVTFFMAILWIGAFSYFMVWWAALAGVVFGMQPEIMGLTFLAAGTSVPDLLTSVIVASKGYGDMAVSSSIGSNVFDVTVGLPVPWLLYSVAVGRPIVVGSSGLFSSVVVLFLMLVLVVAAIAMAGWRLTLGLGFGMFALYAMFLTYSFLSITGVIPSF